VFTAEQNSDRLSIGPYNQILPYCSQRVAVSFWIWKELFGDPTIIFNMPIAVTIPSTSRARRLRPVQPNQWNKLNYEQTESTLPTETQ
jgi:hypothetical protein